VLPTAQSAPVEITAGPDGNLWFTESGAGKIGRITPAGKITEFVLSTLPLEITAGPDGNLWFTDSYQLGRITPSGKITEFTLPSTTTASTTISLGYLVFGPKGRLWFSDKTEDAIGYITSTQFNA
jgi:virginiamycin B lyase